MRFAVDSEILQKEGLSMQDFSVILYYVSEGTGVLNEDLCKSLWERGWLIKVIDGYTIDGNKRLPIEHLTAESALSLEQRDRCTILAEKLRECYPKGKKAGTIYYWQDSVKVIAQRLSVFFKKYGDSYTDDEIVEATKSYISSWNGDYRYMQLLKYFISKKNIETGEDNSELLSYLENKGQEDEDREDWITNMI